MKKAIVTYLVNDLFAPGAIALLESIKLNSPESKIKCDMVCLCLDDVSEKVKTILSTNGFKILRVSSKEYIHSKRNDFKDRYADRSWMMFTKLWIFSLVKYEKILYLDADVVVNKNIDSLLNLNSFISGVNDNETLEIENRGLNAGVLFIKPSLNEWEKIRSSVDDFFPGGHTDQSLINHIYKNQIEYLEPKYNVLDKSIRRRNILIKNQFFKESYIYHFNGGKPWMPFYKKNGWSEATDLSFLRFCSFYLRGVNSSYKFNFILNVFIPNLLFSNIIYCFKFLRLASRKIINILG